MKLILIFLISFISSLSFALDQDESKSTQSTMLPVYIADNQARQFEVSISAIGDKQIVEINRAALIKAIKEAGKIVPEKLESLKNIDISLDELVRLGFWCEYDEERLRINISMPIDPKNSNKVSLYGPQDLLKDGENLSPAKYSGYLNSSVTAGLWRDQGLIDYGTPGMARLDSTINLNGYVVESGGLAQTDQDFQRDDLRVTKQIDGADKLRVSVGDLYYPVIGFQTYIKMGGVGAYTANSLYNGYLGKRASQHQIEVKLPSSLTFYVNGQPVASRHFIPGLYDISDIPLVTGSNQVKVVIQADNTGQSETIMFDDFFSEQGIKSGTREYSFAVGQKSNDQMSSRVYDSSNTIAQGNFRIDQTDKLSTTGYFQANSRSQLIGSLQTLHIKGGHIEFGEAGSSFGKYLGLAGSLTYYKTDHKMYSLIDGDKYSIAIAKTSPGFTQVEGLQSQGLLTLNSNYTFPQWKKFHFGLGASYSKSDFLTQDAVSYSGTASRSIGNYFVSMGITQSSGQLMPNQTMATLSVNWTPPGERSVYYNVSQLGQSQVTNSLEINTTNDQDVRGNLSKSSSPISDSYSAQVTGTTNRNEITFTANRSTPRYSNDFNEQFNVNTRFAVAFADSNWAIGRPIDDSFFITNSKHDDYQFQTNVGTKYSQTGPMGEALVGFSDGRSSTASVSAGGIFSKIKNEDKSYVATNTFKNGYVIEVVRKVAPTTIELVAKNADQVTGSEFVLTNKKTGAISEYFVSSDLKVFIQDIPAGEYEYAAGDYRGSFDLKTRGGEFKLNLDN